MKERRSVKKEEQEYIWVILNNFEIPTYKFLKNEV